MAKILGFGENSRAFVVSVSVVSPFCHVESFPENGQTLLTKNIIDENDDDDAPRMVFPTR
jgi:hypothetical protein